MFNQENLQKEVDKISKNQFQILPFSIDESMAPVLNYIDLETGHEWSCKIPSIIDSKIFLIEFFREKVELKRDKRLKDILD